MIRITPLPTLLALALATLPLVANARTTNQEDVLKAALLPGWQMATGAHMAGVKLELAPGWKTYWRSPGDAGIPPEFDWAGSENLKSVRIHWPAPVAFHTNGYLTIGYKGGVVLPLELEPRDPSQPVVLRTKVELGICRDICMPAMIELQTRLDPPGKPDAAIKAALAAQPAAGKEAGLVSAKCQIEPIADGLRVTATLTLPAQGGTEAVAFETADPRVWVSESQTHRQGTTLVASAELVGPGGQPFALDRSTVTMTVIADQGAVEIRGCAAP